ncbi:putative ATP-dependent kinase [Rhodotorula paludigena]|uniref:putative ATP-dependent kinase n=1 Tax=Rhodotorula paludigena TaxID=86838 RepID=UPI00317A9B5E
MSSTNTTRTAAELIAEFIAAQLEEHRARWTARNGAERRAPPFVCAIQGPQGSGKSYTASKLPDLLASLSSSAATPIRTAALSLDDLYLPHDNLVAVAAADPSNALLAGRGQAGTHDLALGVALLSALKNPSSVAGESNVLELPVFEKSLHGGAGDRLPREQWVRVERPSEVDVVVFEGWMNGFRPLDPPTALGELYRLAKQDPARAKEQLGIDYEPPFLLEHQEEHLAVVQDKLAAYRELWDMVDAFVQIRPEKMGFVWEWRLEQEHNMKAKNGGVGMTDEQVKHFIARYMPGYELWLRGIDAADASWAGKGLRVVIDKARAVSSVERF